jgi:hypothetical protein
LQFPLLAPSSVGTRQEKPFVYRTLFIAAAAALAAGPAEWKTFTPAGAGFAVSMPDVPTQSVIYTPTSEGRIETHIASVRIDIRTEYMVTWTAYRRDALKAGAEDRAFERARDALVTERRGRILSDSAISVDGFAGHATTFAVEGDRVVQLRLFARGSHFYQVMTDTANEPAAMQSARTFLDSFTQRD